MMHSFGGTWVAQLSDWLDFGSGHDLMVRKFESHFGLWADSVEPAWDLSLLLSLSFPCSGMLFLSKI